MKELKKRTKVKNKMEFLFSLSTTENTFIAPFLIKYIFKEEKNIEK